MKKFTATMQQASLMKVKKAHRPLNQKNRKTLFDPAAVLDQLAGSRVLMPNRRGVVSYLALFPRLGKLLPKICGQVRLSLGPEVELSLELYQDLEIDDRYLTLYVRQDHYDANTIKRIESLREQTNPKLELVPGYFLLMTDFRRPRGNHAV